MFGKNCYLTVSQESYGKPTTYLRLIALQPVLSKLMLDDGGGTSLFYQDCRFASSIGRKGREEIFKHLDGSLG